MESRGEPHPESSDYPEEKVKRKKEWVTGARGKYVNAGFLGNMSDKIWK